MEKIEGFKLKQLNVAAFLYASGLELSETVRVNNEVFFVFTPKKEAELLVESYFMNSAKISPKDLFSKLNELRDIIFSGGKKYS